MRATLHIGTEKTGTKTLQEFFDCNRRLLLEQGILYTRSPGRRNNRKLALLGYPITRRDDITISVGVNSNDSMRATLDSVFQLLAKEIGANRCNHVVFSSEHLQSRLRDHREIERLRCSLSELGFDDIEVVVYLRNPVSICRSLYTSSVATGSTARQPPPPDNAYFSMVCDHRRTLKTWSDVFGHQAIRPRLYDRATMLNGSIIDDFCRAVGIDMTDDFIRPDDRNESLSQLAVELLSRINLHIPRIREGKIDEERESLVGLVRQYCAGPSYSPPVSVLEQYREHYAESNEWVRRRYFPERATLFSETSHELPAPTAASDTELDAMAGLVIALWRSRRPGGPGIGDDSIRE